MLDCQINQILGSWFLLALLLYISTKETIASITKNSPTKQSKVHPWHISYIKNACIHKTKINRQTITGQWMNGLFIILFKKIYKI